MNGHHNRNGRTPVYPDPRQTPDPRRNTDPRQNRRSNPRPDGGRSQGSPRGAGQLPPRRAPQNNGQPRRRPDPANHRQHGQPSRGSLGYPDARFGTRTAVPLFQRGWFRIWMMALVLIAVIAIVAVAVSSSLRAGDDTPDTSLLAMTGAAQPPATDAADENSGLFRAFVDDSTADMTADIKSGYGVLIDVAQGKILASRGAYDKINPASMTKLMTLIVAYEHIDDLNGYFEMTSAIIDPVYISDASLAGFSPGETVLIKDLFYGAALPSGADATSALAICAAGDEDSFAVMMNAKAKELGLKDTHFENASGLHGNNHYSTCYDMAVILKCAMDNEFLREVISTYQYTTASTAKHPEGLKLENTMLSRMKGDEAQGFTIIGGKTGYTPNAGHCLASFGKRNSDGAEFILVTAKGADRYTPVYDAIEVYGKYAVQQSRAAAGDTP